MQLDRRAFLSSTSSGVIGLGLGLSGLTGCSKPTLATGQTDPNSIGAVAPLFEISLAQWSLHRSLGRGRKATMSNLEFARVAKEMGFNAIEYVNQFFKDKAEDAAYLAEMKSAAADQGVQSLLIMVDGEGQLGDPDDAKRTKAIENHHKWVTAADKLGCHAIRVNARSAGSYGEQMRLAADGLRRLTEFGAEHAISVIVENHGGLSSNGEWLAGVMKRVGHEHCGTLPDFGNFKLGGGKEYDRYKGVTELMPFAKAVSAKSHDFDADGNETHTDYKRMMQIVVDAGYHGFVGVEYEGNRLGEREGILATKTLLERVRGEIVAK